MDFATLPPEITSGRMYSGPGSHTMVAAAAAWDVLATELQSAAAGYRSAISELTESWRGPSSAAMATAVTPYLVWISATAAQAKRAAAQTTAAVNAFEAAFAATVPPPVIAANRTELATLLATNVLGQNTAAIAAVEAQYAQMWLQNAAMMYSYAAAAAVATAATRLEPFTAPPNPVDPAGQGAQPAAAANAAAALGQVGAKIAEIDGTLGGLLGSTSASALYEEMFAAVGAVSKFSTVANFSMGGPNLGMVQFKTFFKPAIAAMEVPASALGAGLKTTPPALPGGVTATASAGVAEANLVGRLPVPPSWAGATPAIRFATHALPDTAAAASAGVPAKSVGPMAAGSMAAGALGGAAPRVLNATGGHGRATGRAGSVAGARAPVRLDRVIAQLQQQPNAVRHWTVDQAGLDDLIAELSKKPGVHAVHLAGAPKPG